MVLSFNDCLVVFFDEGGKKSVLFYMVESGDMGGWKVFVFMLNFWGLDFLFSY